MLDIDHFKIVNDTYGHPVGDRVIKNLSRLLLQRLRRTDIIGRYGGEEFAVILPDTTSENAVLVLNELREKFAHFRQYGEGTTFFSTISGGVASFPVYGEVNTLCNAADQALYKAKRAGRNQLQTG
jgi:diguanylate cyclase (GGDEF)-like protein